MRTLPGCRLRHLRGHQGVAGLRVLGGAGPSQSHGRGTPIRGDGAHARLPAVAQRDARHRPVAAYGWRRRSRHAGPLGCACRQGICGCWTMGRAAGRRRGCQPCRGVLRRRHYRGENARCGHRTRTHRPFMAPGCWPSWIGDAPASGPTSPRRRSSCSARLRVCRHRRARLGRRGGAPAVAGAGRGRQHALVCSQLVDLACLNAGVHLVHRRADGGPG